VKPVFMLGTLETSESEEAEGDSERTAADGQPPAGRRRRAEPGESLAPK
jgi:hypothetical protein